MGAELCETTADDASLATPSQAFTLLLQGELSPESYPIWIVEECLRARSSEYRRRLRGHRTRGPSGPLAHWLTEAKTLCSALATAAHQLQYDPLFGSDIPPAIAVGRSIN